MAEFCYDKSKKYIDQLKEITLNRKKIYYTSTDKMKKNLNLQV